MTCADAHFISRTATTAERLARILTANEREVLLVACGLSECSLGTQRQMHRWALAACFDLARLGLIMDWNDRTPTALGRAVAEKLT